MPLDGWLTAALAVAALAHLVVVWYLHRRVAPTADSLPDVTTDESSTPDRDDGPGVRCDECGTVNESGYRYCRVCVAELPGATPVRTSGGAALGRGMG